MLWREIDIVGTKEIKQVETEIKESDNKEIEKSICDSPKEEEPKSKSPYNNEITYVW